MATTIIPLSAVPDFLRRRAETMMPTFSRELNRLSLEALWPDPLITEQRRDTGTLQASTIPFVREPVSRNLEHGPGHSPLPPGQIDQVMAAWRPGDKVGVAADAKSQDGFDYPLVIERKFRLYEKAQGLYFSRLPFILSEAAQRAFKAMV